jgi:hypothetical protein
VFPASWGKALNKILGKSTVKKHANRDTPLGLAIKAGSSDSRLNDHRAYAREVKRAVPFWEKCHALELTFGGFFRTHT